MIVHKNKVVQEQEVPLISGNGASKVSHLDGVVVPSDTEVSAMASRRRFTAEYKLGILKAADSCTKPGSLGGLLRREGLYSSNLNTWKRQRDRGSIDGLTPKKRGRKESDPNPLIAENENLRKKNDHLTHRLKQAEMIIDVQKKISEILGIHQPVTFEKGGSDSWKR
jgi:transposase-like protein